PVEDESGSAHLEVRGDLGHVRIAHDDVKATVLLRVRVRLVARVDDGARGGGGPRDLLADVLGPLRETVVEAAGGLEYLARPREARPGDEEGGQALGQVRAAAVGG